VIGPDYSRYASEIIGKAIDSKFRERIGDQCTFIRHVDDIFIGANDHDSANQFLAAIQEAVQYFQLDLNERKTSILPTNLDLEPFWPVKIRREIENFGESRPSGNNGGIGHDFVYFLDEIIRIANFENDDGVIKFSLRKMDESNIWSSYWNIVEPFLIRVAINFPHSWDYVARIASWRQRVHGLDKSLWSGVINNSLARQAASGNDSEVTWALWLAKEAKVEIDLSVLEAVLERCGAISALLALDVYFSNQHVYAFPKAKFLDRIGEQPMLGPDWLLSYEADRLFDLKIKTRNLNGYSFAKELYDNNTKFYDSEALPSVFSGVEDPTHIDAALEDVLPQGQRVPMCTSRFIHPPQFSRQWRA
jgi:hypothetical protein